MPYIVILLFFFYYYYYLLLRWTVCNALNFIKIWSFVIFIFVLLAKCIVWLWLRGILFAHFQLHSDACKKSLFLNCSLFLVNDCLFGLKTGALFYCFPVPWSLFPYFPVFFFFKEQNYIRFIWSFRQVSLNLVEYTSSIHFPMIR